MASRAGSLAQDPLSRGWQVWPTAWFCMACELRIFFIFLSGYILNIYASTYTVYSNFASWVVKPELFTT